MSRPRTGQLIRTRSGFSARFTHPTERDASGRPVRVQVELGTDVLSIAKARLSRLLAGSAENPRAPETFRQACERIVPLQEHTSKKERLYRLRTWAYPVFGEDGDLLVTEVRRGHVKDALARCAAAGKSRSTVSKLLGDIATVLRDLEEAEQIPPSDACKVRLPKAREDKRRRLILTDEEFNRFLVVAPPELATLAACSRFLGGMRTSDLHAWRWEMIDLETWLTATAPRPKTDDETALEFPAGLLEPLVSWWCGQGCPHEGPVFPVLRGPRKGEHRRGKRSYASELRDALWAAGIVRPLPGVGKPTQRSECALQTDGGGFRRPDFHSFRRAYCTGLARAGVTLQTAMAAAGHRVASTAMGYVQRVEAVAVPDQALPAPIDFLAGRAANANPAGKPRAAQCAPPDSNRGPTDSKGTEGAGVEQKLAELRGKRAGSARGALPAESPTIREPAPFETPGSGQGAVEADRSLAAELTRRAGVLASALAHGARRAG